MRALVSPKFAINSAIFLVPALLLWTHNLSILVIALLVVYSIFYHIKTAKKTSLTKVDFLVVMAFSSYFIANIPNVIIDSWNFRYVDGPSRILLCIPIYFLLKSEIRNFDVRNSLELGLIAGSIGTAAISTYQYFTLGMPRVDGFLFSINFGYLACSLAFLNLSLINGSIRKHWLFLGFLFCIYSTVLTLTRGAILAAPLLLILTCVLNWSALKKKFFLMSVILLSLTSIASYQISDAIKERVEFTIQEAKWVLAGNMSEAHSSGVRIQLWYAASESFKQNPLLGLTYSQRKELNEDLYQQGKIDKQTAGMRRGHAHSQYFEMIGSTGLLGIIALVAMLVIPAGLMYQKRKNIWASTGLVFVVGIAIFGLTEVLLQGNMISSYYGFFLALFLAASVYPNKTSEVHNGN
ncbi:hypothetical protein RN22_05545 [Grimontia sp. AD028]|uniref:O-antigen ligase family protein n=1 Tax=Grimontia sp. AD028 TaxID=1581149 RepID=UPI00061AEFF0|nr:O-antigen ligase family protein [Grimontia sp. AD028]KKD61488.1 hypothetical protein RN22_05545 [Grimontia sp. AD028]